MDLKNMMVGVLASGLLSIAPAAFAADVEISGNGAKSDNTVEMAAVQLTAVSQLNETKVDVDVKTESDTGYIQVESNTGGTSKAVSGDATSQTTVVVEGSMNAATVENECGCVELPTVLISGNGYKSDNSVGAVVSASSILEQVNLSMTKIKAKTKALTDNLKVKKNTGTGAVARSGSAMSITDIYVSNPINTLGD